MVPRIYSQKTVRLSVLLLFLFVSTFSFGQAPIFTTPAVCPGATNVMLPMGGGTITFTNANIPGLLNVSASDPGGGTVTYLTNVASVDCSDEGTIVPITVIVTNNDAPNETATCLINATILSSGGNPTATCMDITVNLSGGGLVTPAMIDGGSMSCSGITGMTINGGASVTYTCAEVGTQMATLAVTDAFGTSTCMATITVVDDINPTFSCPAGQTVVLNGSCEIIVPDLITGIADEADNCGVPAMTQVPAAGTAMASSDGGTINVTVTATDVNSNTTSCTVVLTGDDTTPPVATCQNISVPLDASGNYTLTAAEIDGGSTDNCGTTNISIPPTTFTCADIATNPNMVMLTVDDGNGNSATCMAAVTVVDMTPPPTLPNLTANNSAGNCEATVTFPNTMMDNCGAVPIVITSATDPKGNPLTILISGANYFADFPVGVSTVNYSIDDGTNPPTVGNFTVTVNDNEAPTLTCPANQTLTFAGCNAMAMLPDYRGLSNISDNCSSGYTVVQSPAPGTLLSAISTPADGEMIPVTITVTDGSPSLTNMGASCTFMVELSESNTPTPTTLGAVLPTLNGECGPLTVVAPTALDECGNMICGEPFPPVATNLGVPCVSASGPCTTSSRTSTDTPLNIPDNNSTGITSTITVPTTMPALSVADINVSLDITHTWVGDIKVTLTSPMGTSVVLFDRPGKPASFFGCSGDDLSVSFDDAAALTNANFEATCGNLPAISGTFQPEVPLAMFNNENPAGDWVLTISDNGGGDTGSLDTWTLDICESSASTSVAEYEFPVGTHSITWVFDDGNGHTASQLQQINVTEDVAPPTFNCQDVIVELDANGNASIVSGDVLASSSITLVSGNNGSGNLGNTLYTITTPVATTFTFDWNYNNPDPFFEVFGYFVNGVSTGLANTTSSGTETVVLNAGDEFSFVAQTVDNTFGSASVTITNFDPGFSGDFGLINWTFSNVNADGTFSSAAGEAADNCSASANLTYALSQSSFDCSNLGANTVTLTVTDEAGNPNTCTPTVTVVDNIAPIFDPATLPPFVMNIACDSIIPDMATLGVMANDNCGAVSMNLNETSTQVINSNLCLHYNYIITRTWTASDASGNSANFVQTIFVSDASNPEFTSPNSVVMNVDADQGACQATVSLMITADSISDVCASFSDLTITNDATVGNGTTDASGVYPVGSTLVTFTAVDPCGNTTIHQVTVNVIDNTPPIASCKNNIVVAMPSGSSSITIDPALVDNGSTDNCAPVTLSVFPTTFDCSQADGVTEWPITLFVTEDVPGGTTSTCQTTIIIQDNTPPVAMCQDVTVYLDAAGNASVTAAMINDGSFDACSGIDTMYLLGQTAYTVSDVGSNPINLIVVDSNGNSGLCASTVTVAPPVTCFDIDDSFIAGTGMNEVPLVATNFVNVQGFQFSLTIDTAVAKFVGLNTINSGIDAPNGILTVQVSPNQDTLSVSWLNTSGSPITLNTAQLFTVSVDVVGAVGTMADITFIDTPSPREITVRYGNTLFSGANFPLCTNDGNITVDVTATLTVMGNVRTWGITTVDTTINTTVMPPDTMITSTVVVPVQNVPDVIIAKTETHANINGGLPLFAANAATTDANGNYTAQVQNQPGGIDLILEPSKTTNWLNRLPNSSSAQVNSFDLGAIQQHIVTNTPFTSIFEYLASDVDGDGFVTTLDLVLIQDVIVNPETSPAPSIVINTYSPWRFVPAEDSIHLNPLPAFPSIAPIIDKTISFQNYTTAQTAVDWIAIKVGQVKGNLDPSVLTSNIIDTRTGADFTMKVENKKALAGELISIPVYAKDYAAFAAWQFTLEFDKNALDFETIREGAITDFGEGKLGLNAIDWGIIGAAWYGKPLTIADDEILFTLEFRALKNIDALSGLIDVTSKTVGAESYLTDGSTGNVSLEFFTPSVTTVANNFELHQNRPNPFNGKTLISFTLPNEGFAKLTIMDISGKVLKVVEKDFAKGYNEVSISSNEISATGVLYYQLESAEHTATKKMIILNN